MNEKVNKQLEDILVELGEDKTYLKMLKESYKESYQDKENWMRQYYSHLKEIEKKYYGQVK